MFSLALPCPFSILSPVFIPSGGSKRGKAAYETRLTEAEAWTEMTVADTSNTVRLRCSKAETELNSLKN